MPADDLSDDGKRHQAGKSNTKWLETWNRYAVDVVSVSQGNSPNCASRGASMRYSVHKDVVRPAPRRRRHHRSSCNSSAYAAVTRHRLDMENSVGTLLNSPLATARVLHTSPGRLMSTEPSSDDEKQLEYDMNSSCAHQAFHHHRPTSDAVRSSVNRFAAKQTPCSCKSCKFRCSLRSATSGDATAAGRLMKHEGYRRHLVSVQSAAINLKFEHQQQRQSEHTPHREWLTNASLIDEISHRIPSYEIHKAATLQRPSTRPGSTARATRRHTIHEIQTPQYATHSLHTVYSASETSSSESSDSDLDNYTTPRSRGARFFRDDSVLPSFQEASYSPRAGWHTTTADPELDHTVRRKLFSPLRMTSQRRDALYHQMDGAQADMVQSPEDLEQQRLRQARNVYRQLRAQQRTQLAHNARGSTGAVHMGLSRPAYPQAALAASRSSDARGSRSSRRHTAPDMGYGAGLRAPHRYLSSCSGASDASQGSSNNSDSEVGVDPCSNAGRSEARTTRSAATVARALQLHRTRAGGRQAGLHAWLQDAMATIRARKR